jgi:hypothetical protein
MLNADICLNRSVKTVMIKPDVKRKKISFVDRAILLMEVGERIKNQLSSS